MADYIDDDNLWKEDLFATLNVANDASDAQIKKAYLKLAKKYHPDKFLEENEEKLEAQRIFSKVTVAYNTLTDPQKKKHYLELRRLLADHLPPDQTPPPAPENKEPAVKPSVPSTSSQPTPVNQSQPAKKEPAPAAEKLKEEQANTFYNKGMDFMKKKKTDKAIENFKQAITLKKDVAKFHTQLGIAYVEKNWTGMAQAEFKTALKYDPEDRLAKKNYVPESKNSKTNSKGKKQPEKKGLLSNLFGFGRKK